MNNNPLSFTDPTGFFLKKLFKKIGRFFKKYWRVIVTIAVAVVAAFVIGPHVAGLFGYFKGSLGYAMISGAVGGFAGGVAGTLVHGGGIGDALKAGLKGAFFGAISAGIAHEIGVAANADKWHLATRSMAHGVSQGALSEAQGGDFLSGFFSGFASSFVTKGSWAKNWETPELAIAGGIVGGTSSVIGGGKFENGAVTGAFVALFNGIKTSFDRIVSSHSNAYAIVDKNAYSNPSEMKTFVDGLARKLGSIDRVIQVESVQEMLDAVTNIQTNKPDLIIVFVHGDSISGPQFVKDNTMFLESTYVALGTGTQKSVLLASCSSINPYSQIAAQTTGKTYYDSKVKVAPVVTPTDFQLVSSEAYRKEAPVGQQKIYL